MPKPTTRRSPVRQQDIQGLKYFRLLDGLLDGLHNDATERDRSKNRKLFYDQYAALLLLSLALHSPAFAVFNRRAN
jgi:hypothetical protein